MGAQPALKAAGLGAVLLLALAGQAQAQTCDSQDSTITGSLSIGDGSTPPNPQFAIWAHAAENPAYYYPLTIHATPGSVSGQLASVGSFVFDAVNPYYCKPPLGGSASCSMDQNQCLHCGGSFSLTVYSPWGAFSGTVRDATTGEPAAGQQVKIKDSILASTTDANGYYKFNGDPPNNWGPISVGCPVGGGPGTATVFLYVDDPANGQTATTSSNQNATVDLEIAPKCPGRCPFRRGGKGPSPGLQPPTNAGRPVHIPTGNVWFDQTDITLPGVALTRSYNSQNAYSNITGAFGRGWTYTYERALSFPKPGVIMLTEADGVPLYFQDMDGDFTYQPSIPRTEPSALVKGGSGQSVTYTRTFKWGASETYDIAGRLSTIMDESGNVTTLGWDASGRLTTIADPGSRALTLVYDSSGHVIKLSGPAGPVATYSYDPGNLLANVTYADGSGYRFTYDASGQVLTVADNSGRIVESHEYSGDQGATSEISDGIEKLSFSYEPLKTTVTDALGSVTTYDWINIHGNRYVTSITGPCSSCGGGAGGETQTWAYDENGRIISYTDAINHTTTYQYDADGNLVSETDALSRTTNYTYDSKGRLLTQTGPDGGITSYTQGAAGPLGITDPLSRTTTISYSPQGRPASITDARGKTTTLSYNTFGDLESVTDPLGRAAVFGYDTLGRRISVTDPLNNTTTTGYDARGRVNRITNPDGTHTDFAYDLAGRRTSVADPMARTTYYAYDAYGRLEKVVDPANGITAYGYDVMGNLTSLTDAKGQITTFQYDGYNRVSSVVYPGGVTETLTYDAAGRLATKADRKGVVTTHTYDALGRLTGKSYSDGTPAVSYSYDTGGRLATAANGTDTLIWTYDLAGQLLSEQSSKNASTVAYTYDAGGNRLSVGVDGAVFVTYAYDDASRLTTISRGTNNFTFGYDNANRRTSMTYPNGVATNYTYDTLSRLTNLTAALGATTITSSGYAYDSAGNRTSKTMPDYSETYGYDPLYRLTDVTRGTSLAHVAYDGVGNRLSEQVDGSVTSGTFNAKNQLLSLTGGGTMRWRGTLNEPGNVTFTSATVNGNPARMLAGNVFEADLQMATGTNIVTVQATDVSGNVTTKNYSVNVSGLGATYTYDSNGNLTSKTDSTGSWTYEWNAENQLTRVLKNGGEVARFAYDPIGRRVEKVAGGVMTTHTYEGQNILRQVNPSGTLKYLHGPGIDQPLAQEDGAGVLSYMHADGLGSVVKTTSSAGTVTAYRQYDAFGNLQVGTTIGGYAFTGREWDPETNLYYYRARYYDPKIGRFISEDPIGFRGGMNFYAYTRNNPVRFSDPFGLTPYTDCLANCLHDTLNQNLQRLRCDLKRAGIAGPTIGITVCTAIVASEPELAPAFPACALSAGASTTGILAVGGVGRWNITNVSGTIGCLIFCKGS